MSDHFLDTSGLVKHYHAEIGLTHALHTLDSLQLAVALDLRRRGMLDQVVTADRVLLLVAALEGLPVLDPEHP